MSVYLCTYCEGYETEDRKLFVDHMVKEVYKLAEFIYFTAGGDYEEIKTRLEKQIDLAMFGAAGMAFIG